MSNFVGLAKLDLLRRNAGDDAAEGNRNHSGLFQKIAAIHEDLDGIPMEHFGVVAIGDGMSVADDEFWRSQKEHSYE